jgi:endoglucanase
MKKNTFILLMMLYVVMAQAQTVGDLISNMDLTAKELAHYMAPGWNLGNTMEANNTTSLGSVMSNELSCETAWQGTVTTQSIIDYVKSQGYKSVRIPCSWYNGHYDSTTGKISSTWMARVKEIVDYCINDGLYVELNDHYDGGWLESSFSDVSDEKVAANSEILKSIWTQIAEEFKNYDEHLLFGGANEPNAKTSAQVSALLKYHKVFIDAVRATGGNNAKRVLVIQGPTTDIDATVSLFPAPSDATFPSDAATNRLMIEVHFYSPWNFCGLNTDNGSSPSDGNWNYIWYYWGTDNLYAGSKRNSASSTMESFVETQMEKMKTRYVDAGVPVILGEYGANWRTISTRGQSQAKHNSSVQTWYQVSTCDAMQNGMIPFPWDINGNNKPTMSIIQRSDNSIYNQYASDGIKAGVAAATTTYNTIYPEPSTTSGIVDVKNTEVGAHSSIVYDMSGRVICRGGTTFPASRLHRGFYVFNGKKYIVK